MRPKKAPTRRTRTRFHAGRDDYGYRRRRGFFFATLLAMAALRPVAVAVDLVDKPGGRKKHRGEVPVVEGIAMFMGCIFGLGLLPAGPMISAPMLSAAALVVLVGMLDDRFEISPVARLTAHLAAALLVLSTSSSLAIHTLGSPFGSLTEFSAWQTSAFTCVAVMGAISTFNMLDGMDSLAGTMAGPASAAHRDRAAIQPVDAGWTLSGPLRC